MLLVTQLLIGSAIGLVITTTGVGVVLSYYLCLSIYLE